jgi:hypothetical protein
MVVIASPGPRLSAARGWAAAERILAAELVSVRACSAAIAVGAAAHGLALGATSGEWAMALFSAIKVPLLLLVSSAVTLPNFFVLHAALGLRADFGAACRGLFAAQAALALVLGATAPLVVFFACSVDNPYLLTVLDGLLFLAGVAAAQVVLRRCYRPLLLRDRRHRLTLASWAVLYVFFAVQLAWVLRPFLGTEGYPVEFLRPNAFEQNAYLVLVEHLVRAVSR